MNDEDIKFKVFITEQALKKIRCYTELQDSEIMGLLEIEEEEGVPTIMDIHLLKQEVTGSSCELDTEKLGEFIHNNPLLASKIKGWWHSHYNFGAYFSSIDDEAIDNLLKHLKYCVSICSNQEKDLAIRFDLKVPRLTFEKVGYEVPFKDDKFKKKCEKEIKKFVKETFSQPTNTSRCYGHGGVWGYENGRELQYADDYYNEAFRQPDVKLSKKQKKKRLKYLKKLFDSGEMIGYEEEIDGVFINQLLYDWDRLFENVVTMGIKPTRKELLNYFRIEEIKILQGMGVINWKI